MRWMILAIPFLAGCSFLESPEGQQAMEQAVDKVGEAAGSNGIIGIAGGAATAVTTVLVAWWAWWKYRQKVKQLTK